MSPTRYANRSCPVCVRRVTAKDKYHNCDHCRLSYHAACWLEAGGCTTPECPFNPNEQTEPVPPSPVMGASSSDHPRAEPVRVATEESRRDAPQFDEQEFKARENRSLWLRPEGMIVYATIVLCVVTALVTAWKLKERQAASEFKTIIARADAAANPAAGLSIVETYLRSHPNNRFTRQASDKLGELRSRIQEYDFSTVMAAADAAGERYETALSGLRTYLETNPQEAYRLRVQERITQIPSLIDDRDFQRIDQKFPAASGDLDRRKTALEEYLSEHPTGAHMDAARNALAPIPDLAEERRFAALKARLASIKDNDSQTKLALLDEGSRSFAAPKRIAELQKLRQDIISRKEQVDLQNLLARGGDSPAELEQRIPDTRLFLLCYPQSKAIGQVRQLLDQASVTLRKHDWPRLQSELTKASGDDAEYLKLLDRYRRVWPDPESQRMIRAAVLSRQLDVFKQAVSGLETAKTGTIIPSAGKPVKGRISKKGTIYTVILESGEKRVIDERLVQKIELSDASVAIDQINSATAGLLDDRIDPKQLEALLDLADKRGLAQYALLIRVLLAEINPGDTQNRRQLCETGAVRESGRWKLATAVPHDRLVNDLLEAHKSELVNLATSIVAGLNISLTYSQYGIEKEIPVKCATQFDRFEIPDLPAESEPLVVTCRVHFTVKMSPTTTQDQKVTKMVNEMASKKGLEAEVEIKEQIERTSTLGIACGFQGEKCLIRSLSGLSPADMAGLEPGDEIVAVNSQPASSFSSQNRLPDLPVGDKVIMDVKRRDHVFRVEMISEPAIEKTLTVRGRIKHNFAEDGAIQADNWVNLRRQR